MARGFYGRVGIDITDTLTDGLTAIPVRARRAARNAVSSAAEAICERAYELANVSPGVTGHGINGEHMRDEIKFSLEEDTDSIYARIGVDMSIIPYAAHQEFGVNGKPYLRPAIDEGREFAHIIMAEKFSTSMKDDLDVTTFVRFRRFA